MKVQRARRCLAPLEEEKPSSYRSKRADEMWSGFGRWGALIMLSFSVSYCALPADGEDDGGSGGSGGEPGSGAEAGANGDGGSEASSGGKTSAPSDGGNAAAGGNSSSGGANTGGQLEAGGSGGNADGSGGSDGKGGDTGGADGATGGSSGTADTGGAVGDTGGSGGSTGGSGGSTGGSGGSSGGMGGSSGGSSGGSGGMGGSSGGSGGSSGGSGGSTGGSGASTQECLLTPVAVPGLSGLPFWYAETGKVSRFELDDPRWGAGPLQPLASDGGGTSAGLRMVRDGDILAISFQAMADSSGASTYDAIYIGISPGLDGAKANLARLRPQTTGATDPVAKNTDTGSFWARTVGSWGTPGATVPTWLVDTDPSTAGTQFSTWRNSPAGAVWAVNLKINLADAGIPPGQNFRMFFGVEQHQTGTNCVVTPGACTITSYTTPQVASGAAKLTGTPVPDDPNHWLLMEALSTACADGASLSSATIGIINLDGAGTTVDRNGSATTPATASTPAVNTFYADVFNVPGAVAANKIQAKFSIANWGSTIADPNAPWDVVVVSPGPTAATTDDVLANAIPNSAGPAPGGPADSVRIQFTCDTGGSGDSYCPKLASGLTTDQCILVELSSVPPQNVKFSKATAYSNMNFETLSEMKRDATISIEGLKKATGVDRDRDVYLYVKTTNLPAHGEKPLWLPTKEMAQAKAYAEHPPRRPPPETDLKEILTDRPSTPVLTRPLPAGAVPSWTQAELARLSEEDVPVLTAHQKLEAVWPTYEVHVYYDAGDLVERDSAKLKHLVEMMPFGFYLSHDGPLYGFTHSLEGIDGAKLEPLRDEPNWYRVRIESEGSMRLQTTVRAEETPRRDTWVPQTWVAGWPWEDSDRCWSDGAGGRRDETGSPGGFECCWWDGAGQSEQAAWGVSGLF